MLSPPQVGRPETQCLAHSTFGKGILTKPESDCLYQHSSFTAWKSWSAECVCLITVNIFSKEPISSFPAVSRAISDFLAFSWFRFSWNLIHSFLPILFSFSVYLNWLGHAGLLPSQRKGFSYRKVFWMHTS